MNELVGPTEMMPDTSGPYYNGSWPTHSSFVFGKPTFYNGAAYVGAYRYYNPYVSNGYIEDMAIWKSTNMGADPWVQVSANITISPTLGYAGNTPRQCDTVQKDNELWVAYMAPVSYTVFPWSVNTARITLGKFDMATDTWTPAVESGPLLTFDSVFRLLKIERRGGSFAIAYTDDDKAVSVWDVGGSARRVSPLPGVDGILANVLQAMAVDASDVVHIAYGAKTRLAAGNASCSVEYASQEMDGTTTHVQMIPGYDEGSALGSIGWAGGVISGVPWFSTSEYDLIEYNPHYRLASPGLALVNPAEDADYTVDVDGVAGVMRNDGKYYAGVQAIMPGASYPGKTFVVPYDGSVLGGRIILQDTLASRYTTQMLMGAGADGDIGIVTRGTPGYKWMFWRIKGEAAGCPNWAT